MATALLVIDVQQGFFRREKVITDLDKHLPAMNRLIDAFAKADQPVVFVRTVHDPDGSTWTLKMRAEGRGVMLAGSDDVKDAEGLRVPDGARSVTKTRHSAFVRTDIEPLLKTHGVDRLVLAGIFLEACVGDTAADAVEHDFPTAIAREATMSNDRERAQAMLAFLKHEFQIECRGIEEIIATLARPTAARAMG